MISTEAEVRELLEATQLRRLPGFGGKVAETLQQAGAQSVADIKVRQRLRHMIIAARCRGSRCGSDAGILPTRTWRPSPRPSPRTGSPLVHACLLCQGAHLVTEMLRQLLVMKH